jgi:hypothetical protein
MWSLITYRHAGSTAIAYDMSALSECAGPSKGQIFCMVAKHEHNFHGRSCRLVASVTTVEVRMGEMSALGVLDVCVLCVVTGSIIMNVSYIQYVLLN